jgi:hypothetical protein
MAVTVNEEKNIKLIDGTEIRVRPLKISLLQIVLQKLPIFSPTSQSNW